MADIYQAKDFEDWYKHHYKTDYDGNNTWTQTFKGSDGKEKTIGDYDWQAGQKLYNLYQQGQQYQTEHDNEVTASAQRAMEAKIAADVSRQRLEKYLPQQLALQGLYGTGMSEDSYLKLQNQYQKAVGDANAMHNQNLKDYKSTLDGQKFGLNTQAQAAVQGVIDKKTADDEKVKADQQAAFEEGKNALYEATNEEQLVNAYYAYKDKIPPEMAGLFEQIKHENSRNIIAENEEAAKAEAEAAKEANKTNTYRRTLENSGFWSVGNDLQAGDNLKFKGFDGQGKEYVVESDGKVDKDDNPEVYDYAKENVNENDFFIYDNEIYIYFNKKVYAIRRKNESHQSDYDNLIEYLKKGVAF